MDKKDKTSPVGNEKKKPGLLDLIVRFFFRSIFPTELMNINHCLIKAHEIAPNSYFMKLLYKNRVIITIAAAPSIINLVLLYNYVTGDNLVTNTIKSSWIVLNTALKSKNMGLINTIVFPMDFWIYICALMVQIIVMTFASYALMLLIKKLDPVLRESEDLRNYCISHNYAAEEDSLFLVCKAGVMAKLSKGSGEDLIKDKHLWRILNKQPKDPIDSPKDRSLVFIGNGFTLQKYEFKI